MQSSDYIFFPSLVLTCNFTIQVNLDLLCILNSQEVDVLLLYVLYIFVELYHFLCFRTWCLRGQFLYRNSKHFCTSITHLLTSG